MMARGKCSGVKVVRAKVKNQPELSKFYLVKRGNTLLFSAKTKSEAQRKARSYRKFCKGFS